MMEPIGKGIKESRDQGSLSLNVTGVHVGISGWTYPPWRGRFYPKGLPHKHELDFAARAFNSIEINGTFYTMQTPRVFGGWFERTPDDFVFAVKGSRFITHMKMLNDVTTATANFFASGLLALRHKLGPILWQFPERMPYLPDRLESFLNLLPRTFKEAAALGRRHDDRLKARAFLRVDEDRPIRHAMEFRNDEFFVPDCVQLLRKYNVAWVIADAAGKFPYAEDVTSDFVYIRLHGSKELYASGYGNDELKWWTDRIRTWRSGREPIDGVRIEKRKPRHRASVDQKRTREIFVYFDNDAKVHAPFNAGRLAEMLDIRITEPAR